MAKETSVEALLESGAHFGHLTRRWNPKMRKFIYTERNGIHIIDLRKTKVLLDIASEAAHDAASQGKVVLFVGTKNQAKEAIQNAAKRCGAYYVSERWLGGMLTNFSTIRKSIKRLASIDKMEADGTFEKFTKKERLMLNRERERLRRVFGGIEEMTRIPGAIFVVDVSLQKRLRNQYFPVVRSQSKKLLKQVFQEQLERITIQKMMAKVHAKCVPVAEKMMKLQSPQAMLQLKHNHSTSIINLGNRYNVNNTTNG